MEKETRVNPMEKGVGVGSGSAGFSAKVIPDTVSGNTKIAGGEVSAANGGDLSLGFKESSAVESGKVRQEAEGQQVLKFEDFDEELESTNLFRQYVMNPKFPELMKDEPCKGVITKVVFGKSESLVMAVKILRWTKNISPRNQADRDYLAFKGVNKSFDATVGELIGFKSGRPYWGVRFHFPNGETMNYAFTIGDMRILCELSVFKKLV